MVRIREPRLEFAFGEQLEDPRDGLTMFGPYDRGGGAAYGIRAGVIGTKKGIEQLGKMGEIDSARGRFTGCYEIPSALSRV